MANQTDASVHITCKHTMYVGDNWSYYSSNTMWYLYRILPVRPPTVQLSFTLRITAWCLLTLNNRRSQHSWKTGTVHKACFLCVVPLPQSQQLH